MIEYAADIHRHQLRRLERPQFLRVTQPAAREVPAALGRGSDVAIKALASPGGERLTQLVVGAVGLRPRLGPIVPIAIEHRSVREPPDSAIRLAGSETPGSIPPERTLRLQPPEVPPR